MGAYQNDKQRCSFYCFIEVLRSGGMTSAGMTCQAT